MNLLTPESKFVPPTVGRNEEINKAIYCEICGFREKILKEVPLVRGIFLVGGMARGEGTVLSDSEKFEIISDYDFVVVTSAPKILAYPFAKDLEKRHYPKIEIALFNENHFNGFDKRIIYFELFESGLCVYGEKDFFESKRFDSSELDKFDGLRLLFNRVYGLVLCHYPGFPVKEPSAAQKHKILKECAKGILSCIEALLVLDGSYAASYAERSKRFLSGYDSKWAQIFGESQDFASFAGKALAWRTFPSKEYGINERKLWFIVRGFLQKAIAFYAKQVQVEQIIEAKPGLAINAKYLFLKMVNGCFANPLLIFSRPAVADRSRACLAEIVSMISEDNKLSHGLTAASSLFLKEAGYLGKADTLEDWRHLMEFIKSDYRFAAD